MKFSHLLALSALMVVASMLACMTTPAVVPTLPPDAPGLAEPTTNAPSVTITEIATNTPPPPTVTLMPTPDALTRQTLDLPDDLTGQQVHLMYVLASDGVDRELDTNGVIHSTVAAWQHWLADQTGGRTIRLDTYQGEIDITFHRLSRTQDDLRGYDQFMRDQLEGELMRAGFGGTEKLLAVYYDGIHNTTCGDSSWPPVKVGTVAALYLHGLPDFVVPCEANPFAPSIDQPGYLEFSMLHEIMHAIGITPECAPNHTLAGHTSDSNTDLMYAGDQPWYPSALDVGHDDYYLHDNPNCPDLADSGWLMP